jgi:hypothetical protein
MYYNGGNGVLSFIPSLSALDENPQKDEIY